MSFWRYKDAVRTKVPNGFDLENMDQAELDDIIRTRIIRKRILLEASKVIKKMRKNPPEVSAPVPVTFSFHVPLEKLLTCVDYGVEVKILKNILPHFQRL